MSSRRSSLTVEGLPSSKYGERTPLRSLENGMAHLTSPSSRLKLVADAVKTAKDEALLCDTVSHLHTPSTSMVQTSTADDEAVCADVTFKSFVCPGGEVEITDSSLCAEQGIILPLDQATCKTEAEDTVISNSMIVQSSGDHVDHPYCTTEPRATNASCLEIDAANTELHSGIPDNELVTHESDVEGLDVVEKNESVCLPEVQLCESLLHNTVNSINSPDNDQPWETEHADHPNSVTVVPVITTVCDTPHFLETCSDGVNDVTFKSFYCSGGEIEILEGTNAENMTINIPTENASIMSYSYSLNESSVADDSDVLNSDRHLDHPYCGSESYSSVSVANLSTSLKPLVCSTNVLDEIKQMSILLPDSQTDTPDGVASGSLIEAASGAEKSNTSSPSDDQAEMLQTMDDDGIPVSVTQDQIQCDTDSCHKENSEIQLAALNTPSLTNTLWKTLGNKSVNSQEQETSKNPGNPEDDVLPSILHKTESSLYSKVEPSVETLSSAEAQQRLDNVSQVQSNDEGSEAKDSALGSMGNAYAVFNSSEKPHVENLTDVLNTLDCPSVAIALQRGILTPDVRRASLAILKAFSDPAVDNFLAEDSFLNDEKGFEAPVKAAHSGLWVEPLESPMPRPLLNSTVLRNNPQLNLAEEPVKVSDEKPCVRHQTDAEKPVIDIPMITDGPLQQQLRQMADFLILACGKIGPAGICTSAAPSAATTVPNGRATPTVTHSVCVGTTAVEMVDHSLNTSGEFERKREVSLVDSCTLTDPLLWNVPPGSLESLPRSELEQRLRSSMIMVEALLQQLAAARAHVSFTGPPPSELREKLVQTDHTELSQTTGYRDLYMEALNRISELELDESSLQNIMLSMQDMRINLTALRSDTDAALTKMKEMEDIVEDDQQSLLSHYGQLKSVFEKTKAVQTRMTQKVREALHQRNDMRKQMEEAFEAKEAAFSTMEQLRTHCATEMSKLERTAGSQQELLTALKQAYPEQVAVNQADTETLNSAHHLLSETMEEQCSLMKELCTVKVLLHKTAPMLLKLNEKAAAALHERDEHISARDQAVREREEIEEELNQATLDLRTAREQIGDSNLQMTILSSEMGVLHEKLTERDKERAQLERKVTELSATVSSTLASYTFLEQALAAETTKLQQSWKDIQITRERGNELEELLEQSEQRVAELSQALSQSEEQLSELQTFTQSQKVQIQQLQDLCTQLGGVQEMNEFLQMENELAREQVAESERLLRANLHGLRERNIQCEDLKEELNRIQLQNGSLQETLECTRSRTSAQQLEFVEKLAQADTEITLLHHTLRGITNELQTALNDEKEKSQKDKDLSASVMKRRHPSCSFVDSIMVALTGEPNEDGSSETPPEAVSSEEPEPVPEIFSETSAFTRITAVTPKKNSTPAKFEPAEDDHSSVAEKVADVGSTVSELISVLKLLQQHKDAQLEELHSTVYGLREEQEAANGKHEAEVSELKHHLNRLNILAERGNQALQQKAQDEKTVAKLSEEIQEVQEILNKHKSENSELRKELSEVRRSLQHSKVESQFLREELKKSAYVSTNPAHFMEEKIQLLKEVERLKRSLQEVEQARVKLLDRAKRHTMIHQTNQQKSETELQILNNMINKVRETLLSLPEIVRNCEELQQLVEFIG